MINKLKSIAKERAMIEAESIIMESVMSNEEIANQFLLEEGESTIEDIYADDDIEDLDDDDINRLIEELPESNIDDDEVLDKMINSDDIGIDDIFEACGEK